MCCQDTEKSALVARYNTLVDVSWKQHTANRLDPAKYLPVEIVNLMFSFVVYHVAELELEDPLDLGRLTVPARETIAGYRDAPLALTFVSRAWCQIAVNYPPLWSTIIIDRSEGDFLERIELFLDRSGKELLDIILLDAVTPAAHLEGLLIEHAHRLKSLVGHLAWTEWGPIPLVRLEPLDNPTGFVNWSVYAPRSRSIFAVPTLKCLHRVQLFRWWFDPESLVQLTYFHNLESLSISIVLEPQDTQWDKKLQFQRLRHLRLCVSNTHWPKVSILKSPWIERLECSVLVDLYLHYQLNRDPSMDMYPQLEACVFRIISLQNLWVHMDVSDGADQEPDTSRLQNIRPSTFESRLERVHLTFRIPTGVDNTWAAAITERFFSAFVPDTSLAWEYGQFPSPTIFTNLKTMHIVNEIVGNQSALVAPEMIKLEFPFLEELYLKYAEPKWIDLLHAPRLISLSIYGFIPSSLGHISNSANISDILLEFREEDPGTREIYLPSSDKLQLDLQITDLFRLNVHPSRIRAVAINSDWRADIICPPHWTVDLISEMLGTVTDLDLDCYTPSGFRDSSQTMHSFLKPFVYLKRLKLHQSTISEPTWIDQLAQHLVDPNFLPELEALSTSHYPLWPDFFQHIQHRQYGFLTGQFQTALKEITIMRPVHGVLLEYLKESLAGRYIGLTRMPPRRKGSKEWPTQPFNCEELDTNGLLCCNRCYKAGLELGCLVVSSGDARRMLFCDRAKGDWELNTVFAP